MSARETEAMVDSMLQDSPLPDTERSDEKLPEDGGSSKLLEGSDGKLPEETHAGKHVPFFTEAVIFLFKSGG